MVSVDVLTGTVGVNRLAVDAVLQMMENRKGNRYQNQTIVLRTVKKVPRNESVHGRFLLSFVQF
jgi:hypothetical protein